MFIPSKYVLAEGTEAPEGTQKCSCKYCQRTFAVPNDEIKNQKLAEVCDDPECQEKNEKDIAAQVAALMKSDSNKESQDVINKALGN